MSPLCVLYRSMTSRFLPFTFVELVSPYNKKNITRWLEDMNFMFSWHIHIFSPPCNILYISIALAKFKNNAILLNYSGTRFLLVCYKAVFSVLTQRSSPQRKEFGSISSKRLLGGSMGSVLKFYQGIPQMGASPNYQLDQLCNLNFILLLLLLLLML